MKCLERAATSGCCSVNGYQTKQEGREGEGLVIHAVPQRACKEATRSCKWLQLRHCPVKNVCTYRDQGTPSNA